MTPNPIAPVLTLLAAVAFAASPLLVPSFSGFDPADYPVPQVDPPVQPAGYAFGIWGPIYLWLIASAIYGLVRRRADPGWQRFRPALIVSLAVGAVWLAVAVVSPVWATVLIWAMLAGALVAYANAPAGDRWWALAPLGLYAGWLSAASCVSLGLVAAGWGWLGPVPAAWAALLLALALATAVARARPSLTYPVAVGWALVAIGVQNAGGAVSLLALAGVGAGWMAVLAWRGGRAPI